MSKRAAFFNALAEELPSDTWGLRLQTELASHLEDAAYFDALEGKNETISEEHTLTALGTPHSILKEFHHAMTYKFPHTFILHALAAGLLATPLVYLSIIGVHTVLLAIPAFGALFCYFFFALAPILRHIDGRAMQGRIIAIIAGLPSLIVGIPMMLEILGTQVQSGDRIPLLISFGIGICTTFLAVYAAAWEVQQEQHRILQKTTIPGVLLINMRRILGITALIFVILALSMSIDAPGSMSTLAKAHFMLSVGLNAPNAILVFLSPITAGWISGIILTTSGLIALGFIGRYIAERKQKKTTSFPWGWIIVTLLTIPLVAFPPKANDIQNITWANIPHTKISETIERGQLGPFYGMMKYVNQNNPNTFSYYVSQDDRLPLQVKQLPDRIFSLTNIIDVNDLTLTTTLDPINGATMQTADVWCHWKNPTSMPFGPIDENGEPAYENEARVFFQNLSPLYCRDLWVGNKEILTVTQGSLDITSSDVTLSTDGDWMLFKHDTDTQHNGTLSPEEVYLIDLR